MNFERISGWASIIGLVLAIVAFFSEDHSIQIWILLIILLIFIFISIVSFHLNNKNSRYLEADNKIRNTFNRITREKNEILKKDLNGKIKELSDICSEYAEAFEIIKHIKIGVCIKYVNQSKDVLYVKDLCRDTASNNSRRHLRKKDKKDPIEHNTDFSMILDKIDKEVPTNEIYYLQNYLPDQHQYNNTHLNTENLPSGWHNIRKRRKAWPLPYKSTIVVPIFGAEDKEVCGFICIDSPKNNGFSDKDDVPIVQHLSLIMRDFVVETINSKE